MCYVTLHKTTWGLFVNINEFNAIIKNGNAVCNAPLELDSGTYDGNNSTLTANGGITVTGDNVVLINLTVCGSISVKGKNAAIQNCRIISDDNAITSYADGLIIKNCEIGGKTVRSVR